jgi:hypothetical protein
VIFAVDDSEILIDGRAHTILAGITFDQPGETGAQIRAIKVKFGLRKEDEIKWNGMQIGDRQQREAVSEELLSVLSHSKFLVTVNEGTDRQVALEQLATQLDDFMEERSKYLAEPAEIQMCCDNGVINSPTEFVSFLKTSRRSRLASLIFESINSSSSELIQCADMCAGFSRLLIDLALGRSNRRFEIVEKFGDGSTNVVDTDMRHLVLFSLRYSMWGEVAPPRDPNNIQYDGTYPFLHVGGRGLRIHSSASKETIDRIYDYAGVVYFGCLH